MIPLLCKPVLDVFNRGEGRGEVESAARIANPRAESGKPLQLLLVLLLSLVACSSEYQDVTIVIDDFRFSPARVDVQAGQAVHLVVRNQGRETHRFQSPLLTQHRVAVVAEAGEPSGSLEQGMPLVPGQRLELDLTLPPGVYHFRCPIKGHRGMQGTIVVS